MILVPDLPAARRLVLVFPELPAPIRLVLLLFPNLDALASVSSRGTRLPPQGRSERRAHNLLSSNECGAGRPCELPQRSCRAGLARARPSVLGHATTGRSPSTARILYAMIHQHRCCASVAHRAPKPRLAQLRPRSAVCALAGLAVVPSVQRTYSFSSLTALQKTFSCAMTDKRHVTALPARAHSASTQHVL